MATAIFFDPRAWLGVALVAPVAVAGCFAPALAFEASAWMGGALGLALAWAWRRPSVVPSADVDAARGAPAALDLPAR